MQKFKKKTSKDLHALLSFMEKRELRETGRGTGGIWTWRACERPFGKRRKFSSNNLSCQLSRWPLLLAALLSSSCDAH